MERNYTISGITKDATGIAVGAVAVDLFNTATDVIAQSVISDASGNYLFVVDKTQQWYAVAYKLDLAGLTVNTLVGV